MNMIIKTIRTLGVASAISLSLASFAAHAEEGTAEQRRACTPDAFRLCSQHIPNIPAITACMIANKSKLSPDCRAAFDKAEKSTKVATKN
jgi:hypothetical protein